MCSIADDANRWHYYTWEQLEQTPSRQDGLTAEDEQRCRNSCVNLIMEIGKGIGWHASVAYLGVQLCHRYFAAHSYKRNDRYCVALACIYLAGKVRDTPKALSLVVQAGEHYRHRARAADTSGQPKPWDDVAHMQAVREEVLDAERAVLYSLGFDLDLLPPYRYLFYYQREGWVGLDVFSTAWILINGTAFTQMSLVYTPQEIASAAVYAAGACLRQPPLATPLPDGGDFCTFFNITAERLQEVLDHMMDVYVVHAALQTGQQPAAAVAAAAAAGVPPPLTGGVGQPPQLSIAPAPVPAAAAEGKPASSSTLPAAAAIKVEHPSVAVKAEPAAGVKAEAGPAPSAPEVVSIAAAVKPEQGVKQSQQQPHGKHQKATPAAAADSGGPPAGAGAEEAEVQATGPAPMDM